MQSIEIAAKPPADYPGLLRRYRLRCRLVRCILVKISRSRAMRVIAPSFLSLMTIGQLSASAADYRFEALDQRAEHSPGHRDKVEIRLVNIGTGQPVANATFVASYLRMPMNGVGSMDTNASFVAEQSVGSYRFAVSVPMTGSWLLDLTAKVPGEPGVIHGSVPLYIEIAGPSRHPDTSGPRDNDQRPEEDR